MTLHEATQDEKVARDRITYPEWGGRLSREQYLEREQVLRAHPFSNGMRSWLWRDGATVLASCETYENDSRIGPKRGVSFSFASVYTEGHLRGRGHATRMMDAVVARLATQPDAQACVLFSDVKERIYARSGFIAVPADDWVMPALEGPPEEGVEPVADPLPAPALAPDAQLTLHPTAGQLDWAITREGLYARFLGRPRPTFHGARADGALALWAACSKDDELLVLWLEGATPGRALRAAQRQAHRCGLNHVRSWAGAGAPPPGARVVARDGELPMFRPYGSVTTWSQVQRALWV
jgi:hypothetical protein